MKFRSILIFLLLIYFIFLSKSGTALDFDDDLNDGGDDLGDKEEYLDNGFDDDGDDNDEDFFISPPWNEDIDTRIINGFTPEPLDNPFVVRLRVTFPSGPVRCTGTLISDGWVLTVAHCAKDAKSIEVQLGLYTRTEGPLQTIFVSRNDIFVHKNFVGTDTKVRNDIALLRLNTTANTLSPRIRPIRFACENDGDFADRISRTCGWGATSDTGNTATETLQCVDMTIISNNECFPSWSKFLLPSHICTSTINNKTTCFGDSGSPLFVSDLLGRPQLVGLTSFGSNPCASTLPSVSTRITSYSRWIANRTLLLCDNL